MTRNSRHYPMQKPVLVTLVCRHTVRATESPIGTAGTYRCEYTPSCGYRVRWASWVDQVTGRAGTNPHVQGTA